MKKNRAIGVLAAMAALIVLLAYTSIVGFGPTGSGAARNITFGLDLRGGVSITYQAVGEEEPSAEDMRDTVYKLQKRVEGYNTEAQVYQEGGDRINIEIPGVSDANAILQELGKPGSLSFQTTDGEEVLTGLDVETASAASRRDNMNNLEYVVELQLTSDGAKKFADATTANVGKQIYIVYDDTTISAPVVNEAITGGTAYISGMASQEEAENLASSIRIGSLSVELEELHSKVIGAQLGQEAISTSLIAGAIGLAIVIVFMAVVYLFPGIVAGISLLIYVGLVLVTLNAFDITLTLAGIAGIILSIGMAVDANVIIYARIREEIAEGKTVRLAIRTGFKKALSAIVDGNVTTLIAALVLGIMGTGSVKGFASTLALGIVLSMFTALVISRLLVEAFYALGVQDEKYYGRAKERKPINFLGKKKICFIISAVLILSGPVLMAAHSASGGSSLNYSLEFQGGTSVSVTFNEAMSLEEVDSQVKPVISGVTGDVEIQAQTVENTNEVILKTKTMDVDQRQAVSEALQSEFGIDDAAINFETISSTVSSEMRQDAIVAVIVATICMLIYIWFRFKNIRFAGSAVLALVHDVLVVLAFYALSRVSVGNTFIACMLTIVGYSINATIVIFDRIRENLHGAKKNEDLANIVNTSITQTLTRSIYTSFTTFVKVAVLWIMGVASIKEFALPLMVGIVVGAYSSVCITGSLWYLFMTKTRKSE